MSIKAGFRSAALAFALQGIAGQVYATAFLNSYAEVYAGAHSSEPSVTDSGAATADAALDHAFGDSSFSGTAQAQSAYGVLRNAVAVSLSSFQAESYATSGANCGVFTFCGPGSDGSTILPIVDPVRAGNIAVDTLTIDNAALTGNTGYLQLQFEITGTSSLSHTPNLNEAGPAAQGILTLYKGVFGVNQSFVESWGFTGNESLTSPLIAFTYGTPFSISLNSESFVFPTDAPSSSLAAGDFYDLEATVDFGSTIMLTALGIFTDAGGANPDVAFSLGAESGTAYPVAVPLPAAAWLFGAGLLALAGSARRRAGPHAAAPRLG